MIPNQVEKYAFLFRIVLSIIIVLFAAGISVTDYIVNQEKKLSDRIYPNVYIDDLNVGKKTKKEVVQIFEKRYAPLRAFSLSVAYKEQPIATFSASHLKIKLNINETVNRAYIIGRSPELSSRLRQKMITLFNWGRFDFNTRITYDKKAIDEFITQTEEHYNVPAKNALFEFENNRVVSFRTEENGVKLKSDEFAAAIEKQMLSLKTSPQSKIVVLGEAILKPEVTLAETNQFGIEELVGEGQSDYSGSIPGRVHNIILSASRFHGVLIQKGEEFSFNQIVGDISAATGYQQAYIIKGGKTVLGDGGGVCQVSTTLFRAALNTGLPITQRIAHAYRVGYYENDLQPGFDATVFNPTADFRFKNDTPAAILIQTEIDETTNILRFKFYGKKDGRKVEMSQATLYDVQPPPPPSYQDDPTLKKGTTKQVDFAAWGGKANFSYKVTRNGETLFVKDFYSAYRPWQAVFLVGTAD